MEPTTQIVCQTIPAGATRSPAVLVKLVTYLGYRWHPEYTVYEQFHDFNQEQFHAVVRIYDHEVNSTTVLHTAHGVGVTVDMAVHDAAYAALTRLRREYRELDDSPFRHILIASGEGAEGYYTAMYTPLSRQPFDPQILVEHADGLDRANRALRRELFATRVRLYDALTCLLPYVISWQLPLLVIYPPRTVMSPGVGWPAVGGYTPARGPRLPPELQLPHQSLHGPQEPSVEDFPCYHRQMSGYEGRLDYL